MDKALLNLGRFQWLVVYKNGEWKIISEGITTESATIMDIYNKATEFTKETYDNPIVEIKRLGLYYGE